MLPYPSLQKKTRFAALRDKDYGTISRMFCKVSDRGRIEMSHLSFALSLRQLTAETQIKTKTNTFSIVNFPLHFQSEFLHRILPFLV